MQRKNLVFSIIINVEAYPHCMKNILFNLKNASELPRQPNWFTETLEEVICCLPITPKTCQTISLRPFVSRVLSFSLSDRTLTLAFLYDIVSLFPGEVGEWSGPSAAIDRFNQWRSTQKRDIRTRDHSDHFSTVTAETMRICGEGCNRKNVSSRLVYSD